MKYQVGLERITTCIRFYYILRWFYIINLCKSTGKYIRAYIKYDLSILIFNMKLKFDVSTSIAKKKKKIKRFFKMSKGIFSMEEFSAHLKV